MAEELARQKTCIHKGPTAGHKPLKEVQGAFVYGTQSPTRDGKGDKSGGHSAAKKVKTLSDRRNTWRYGPSAMIGLQEQKRSAEGEIGRKLGNYTEIGTGKGKRINYLWGEKDSMSR